MSSDRAVTDGAYWALVMLLTDYGVTLPQRRLRGLGPLAEFLPAGTRVGVRPRPGWSLGRTARACARIAAQGMRPTVTIPALRLRDTAVADRVLGTLANAGVRDLAMVHPPASRPADVLDRTTRIAAAPGSVRRGLASVTVVGIGDSIPTEPSAELLRSFDALHDVSADRDIAVHLMAPASGRPDRVLSWERRLREHGNRFPVRTVIEAGSLSGLGSAAVALAAAIEGDLDSHLVGVDLLPRGCPVAACRWANIVSDGGFVLDEVPGQSRSLKLLRQPPDPGG